jgi:hypothetical protein
MCIVVGYLVEFAFEIWVGWTSSLTLSYFAEAFIGLWKKKDTLLLKIC